jgi:hypothetical protein
MRPIIYVAAGLIVLMVIAFAGTLGLLGGGISWVATKKVDVEDPKTADTFKTTFEANCSSRATKGIDQQDYQKIALIKQVCACDARALIAYMRRNKDMTVLELEKRLLTREAQIVREFESCNQAFGVDVVPG